MLTVNIPKRGFFILKKMIWALILLSLAGVCSCSPAKKPAPPQNRTIIVPEVSRVTFDTLDIKDAPKVIQDMARVLENQDASAWTLAENATYLVFSQGNKTRNYDLEVDEILQRLPQQGFTWLDVELQHKKRAQPRAGAEPVITVVRVRLAQPPDGVGFKISGPEAASPQASSPSPGITSTPRGQGSAGTAAIDNPAPNQEITSPVRVAGSAVSPGQKRVRISTRGGLIIKEENLPTSGTGAFIIDMTYSPPETPTAGEISVIDPSGGDERILARVPVLIR